MSETFSRTGGIDRGGKKIRSMAILQKMELVENKLQRRIDGDEKRLGQVEIWRSWMESGSDECCSNIRLQKPDLGASSL